MVDQGAIFITGGDFNSIPTDAETIDFCIIDQCEDESWHTSAEEKYYHKEGSYFNNFQAIGDYPGEKDLLHPLYADSLNYFPAIPYQDRNSSDHFTHCTYNNNEGEDYRNWDRKLDYLFTNKEDGFSIGDTHQDAFYLSDHAPVSATLTFP